MTVLAINRTQPGRPAAKPACHGIDALLARARSEVLVMSTRAGSSRSPIGTVRPVDHENLRRGVRYRVLVPDPARTQPQLAGQLAALSLAGAATRTVPEVPSDALVIDGTVAVLPVDQDGTESVAVFPVPSVLAMTLELFERVWAAGVPLTPGALPGEAELTLRERKLLTLLFSGTTDEAAAARLGVGVRTVRRMVSDIMNRLGARSRFQAGAKAAQRGWLLDLAG